MPVSESVAGRLTREWKVPLEIPTIFTTSMPISRNREESRQSPTTSTKADGSQPNDISAQGNYFHRIVFISSAPSLLTNQSGTPKGSYNHLTYPSLGRLTDPHPPEQPPCRPLHLDPRHRHPHQIELVEVFRNGAV